MVFVFKYISKSDVYFAVMVELADMQDLGSCAVRRVGSSPTNRTE